MNRRKRGEPADISADPFRELRRPAFHERIQLLGGRFQFVADSSRLLRVVQHAFSKLPPHRFSSGAPQLLVRLLLARPYPRASIRSEREPPQVRPLAGGAIMCGAMDGANFVVVAPRQRSALVVVSQDVLKFPYHIRYEMLEFAVYLLASRVQGLVSLHAACVGHEGRGILLLGPSGSGKSTVSLHCLLHGLDFLAEDSVLVNPDGLQATGVANFLHVRRDTLGFLEDAGRAALLRGATMIRRRSGVEKFEIDLRNSRYRLAPKPLRIGAVVFFSPKSARSGSLLAPIAEARATRELAASQSYAANQPGWGAFSRRVSRLPAFELKRGRHPLQAVEALKLLLASDAP